MTLDGQAPGLDSLTILAIGQVKGSLCADVAGHSEGILLRHHGQQNTIFAYHMMVNGGGCVQASQAQDGITQKPVHITPVRQFDDGRVGNQGHLVEAEPAKQR
jgi:hypothetical protein